MTFNKHVKWSNRLRLIQRSYDTVHSALPAIEFATQAIMFRMSWLQQIMSIIWSQIKTESNITHIIRWFFIVEQINENNFRSVNFNRLIRRLWRFVLSKNTIPSQLSKLSNAFCLLASKHSLRHDLRTCGVFGGRLKILTTLLMSNTNVAFCLSCSLVLQV